MTRVEVTFCIAAAVIGVFCLFAMLNNIFKPAEEIYQWVAPRPPIVVTYMFNGEERIAIYEDGTVKSTWMDDSYFWVCWKDESGQRHRDYYTHNGNLTVTGIPRH